MGIAVIELSGYALGAELCLDASSLRYKGGTLFLAGVDGDDGDLYWR